MEALPPLPVGDRRSGEGAGPLPASDRWCVAESPPARRQGKKLG